MGSRLVLARYFEACSTWEGSRTLYREDLFVYPEFRRHGAGTALMLHLAQVAQQRKCSRFEWSVLDWNESAIGFYRRLGAEPLSGWTRFRRDADKKEAFLRSPLSSMTLA